MKPLPLPLLCPLLALLQLQPAAAEHAAAEQASYRLETELRQWWAAGLACQRAGGHLAVPRSREAALQLAALMVPAADPASNSTTTSRNINWAYVGYSDLAEEGQFFSVTGVELWASGYEQWHSWNMQAGPLDHCLVLDLYGLYWDVPCNWRLPSLCEMEPAPPTPCPNYEAEDVENAEDTTTWALRSREKAFTLEGRPQRWVAALAHCQRTGRRLAVPRFAADTAVLQNLVLTETLGRGDGDGDAGIAFPDALVAFIGVSDLAQAGTFVTVLGDHFVPPDEAAWNASLQAVAGEAGEAGAAAVGGGGRSCVVVDDSGLYRPLSCDEELAFVCEAMPEAREEECAPPPPPPTEAADAPPPPGRIVLQWRERRQWLDAERHCLLAGGVLATAQTRGEASTMAAMLRDVPQSSDTEIDVNIWAYVGARDVVHEGNFTNIFGTELPMEAAAWGPGQPNGGEEQNCVVLDRAGLLWDFPCDWPLAFFCRRLPRLPPWATDFQGERSNTRWAELMAYTLSRDGADPEFADVDWRTWARTLRNRVTAQPRARPNEMHSPNPSSTTRSMKNQRGM